MTFPASGLLHQKREVNGQGTITFPDGRKYTGAFSNDQINGLGTLTMPDGTQYKGQFTNGIYAP